MEVSRSSSSNGTAARQGSARSDATLSAARAAAVLRAGAPSRREWRTQRRAHARVQPRVRKRCAYGGAQGKRARGAARGAQLQAWQRACVAVRHVQPSLVRLAQQDAHHALARVLPGGVEQRGVKRASERAQNVRRKPQRPAQRRALATRL